jgi:peroxiredoxin
MKTLFLFSLLSFFTISEDQNRGYKVKVGDQLPALELELLDGRKINNDSLKGKVVVLQFTASWCGVCRKEMPHLENDVWKRFKNDDFLLIGIDLKEDLSTVQNFIESTKISYPVAIDKDGSIFEKFTLPKAGVTRNIVINKSGEIIFLSRLFQKQEFNQMIETIDQELKK